MAVLQGSKTWKRHIVRPPKATMRPCELTLTEQQNVRAVAVSLRARYRSWVALAAALGVKRITLIQARPGRQAPTVGLALRLARLAGVTVDGVLAGRFIRQGACFNCGADLLAP